MPAVVARQLSDQGEYPLGLLCREGCSGTRGVVTFVHAGYLVLASSALLPDLSQAYVAFCVWLHVLSFMSDRASLMPAMDRLDIFWKLLEGLGDMDALCAQKWCGPCHVGRELGPYLFKSPQSSVPSS